MPVLDVTELPAAAPPRTPLVGLDLGEKTIGVAVSDLTRSVASPLELIRRTKFSDDVAVLERLMAARGAVAAVIGLPVNMDGTEGPRCQSARAFARNWLRFGADRPIAFWDERLSSAAVNRMLIAEDMTRARRAEVVDKTAAAWILQGALDRLRDAAA